MKPLSRSCRKLVFPTFSALSQCNYSPISFVSLTLPIKPTCPPTILILYKMPGMYRFARVCLCACFLFIKNFNLSYREIKVRRLCGHRAGGGGAGGAVVISVIQSFTHFTYHHHHQICIIDRQLGGYCF